MSKRLRKLTSFLLSIVMAISMVSVGVVSVNAGTVIENAVSWALAIANDNSHGYSQLSNRRWGNPDYDCSSFVITAFKNAGCNVGAATYTGNMRSVFVNAGFTWIPKSQINLSNSSQLQRGDILLNEKNHTEIYIGNNQRVGAHTGTYDIYDRNAPGDNNGKEISVYNYSNSSNWDGVLRYNENSNFPGEEDKSYNVPVWKTANSKLDTYDSNGNKESGRWIDAGDNCYIEKVYKNGYAWVKYPTSNGDRWAYANAFGFSLDKKISYGTPINLGENFSARIRNIQMNKVVTYSNGNAVIGASMNNKLARQIWKFSRNSNGSYRIKSCLNDTCMELHNFGDFDGGNVTCIPANGSTAQNWFICENSDGSLYLRPECSSTRVLDVTGGDAHDGNNMQLWTYNKTDAQMFSIDKCGEVINVGDNFVASIEHTEYWKPLMQAEDGNVVLCTSSQKNMSRILWNFERDSNNGWYTITSYENGKRLEVSNESDEDGANVQCAEARDTYAQYWYILKGWEENGNEYKYIKSACSSKNLDLLYNSKEDGTNIQMWSINGTLAQRFSIYEINGDTTYDISYVDNEIEIGNQTNIIVSNTNFVIQYEFHVIHPNGMEEIIDNKCDNIYSFAPKQAGIYTIFCRVNSPVSSYVGSINDRYVKIRVSNKLGDINADGNINILDATMIQKHSAELELLDDNLCKYADVNGDGKADIIDATLIQKYSAELITQF